MDALRIDKWLWFARFCKTRGIAQRLIEDGRVRLDGRPVGKVSATVKPGDELLLPLGRSWRRVRVLALGDRRGPAAEARTLYVELAAPATTPDGELAASGGGGAPPPKYPPGRGLSSGAGCVRQSDMIDILKSPILEGTGIATVADDVQLASAALLVEAAMVDGRMDDKERSHIGALLRDRFGLAPEPAEALLARADGLPDRAGQLLPFTKAIADATGIPQRVELIEMLWEVAYADGQLHDYEANLVRRMAGLLHVPDQESGSARRRAMARLGLSDGPLV